MKRNKTVVDRIHFYVRKVREYGAAYGHRPANRFQRLVAYNDALRRRSEAARCKDAM